MKISLKLKNSVSSIADKEIDTVRNDFEQLFRDGKIEHSTWAKFDKKMIDASLTISHQIISAIEFYKK